MRIVVFVYPVVLIVVTFLFSVRTGSMHRFERSNPFDRLAWVQLLFFSAAAFVSSTYKYLDVSVTVKRGRNLMCADGEPPNAYIKVSFRPVFAGRLDLLTFLTNASRVFPCRFTWCPAKGRATRPACDTVPSTLGSTSRFPCRSPKKTTTREYWYRPGTRTGRKGNVPRALR